MVQTAIFLLENILQWKMTSCDYINIYTIRNKEDTFTWIFFDIICTKDGVILVENTVLQKRTIFVLDIFLGESKIYQLMSLFYFGMTKRLNYEFTYMLAKKDVCKNEYKI